jgi:glycosyltransferase involved in cell wall biosynthesis
MTLSILIPSLFDRVLLLDKMMDQIRNQLGQETGFDILVSRGEGIQITSTKFNNVEVIVFQDSKKYSVGFKRNELLQRAQGEYIAFIDDDDRIGPNYFRRVFEGIEQGVDCCSLKGIITEDGNNPLIFEHSIRYKEYKTNPDGMPVRYERFPNHLNCIRASIAKQFSFPEKNHGEDTDWATQIFKSGLIKTEHYIDEVIYMYDYISKK